MNGTSARRALVGIVGDFSDPTNERIIYLSAVGLAIVGLTLLLGTIVWWRRGRQEHPALAPLEVMSGRAWAKAPAGERRRRLDHVRIIGAGATSQEPERAEPLDLEALVRNTPQAFDDLREPGESPDEMPEPAVEGPVVAEEAADVESLAEAEPDAGADADADDDADDDIAEPVATKPAEPAAPAKEPPVVVPTSSQAPHAIPTRSDPDATTVSTQRPAQAVEVLASGPTDPLL